MLPLRTASLVLAILCSGTHAYPAVNDASFWKALHEDIHDFLYGSVADAPAEAHEKPEHGQDHGSFSGSTYFGWLIIHVVGTGKACYEKEHVHGLSLSEEFGDFASSEAFVDFYGYAECEAGDVGFAWGKIRAFVAAAAYEKGPECLSRVLASVVTDPFHQFSHGDVSVRTSGESVGEALALCETPETSSDDLIS